MSENQSVEVFLTGPQKKKFEKGLTFQLSSAQLSSGDGKHHVELILNKQHHKKLLNNVNKKKGFRFTPETIQGGSLLDVFKPHIKSVLKTVAKAALPKVLDYVGERSGHKNLTDTVKPSINGVVDVIAGGKVGGKGSVEMHDKMALLRSMKKSNSINGGNVFDDLGRKIRNTFNPDLGRKIERGFNQTFTPDLGRKIVKGLKSPIAKSVYKGVADLGATALGDFTGNPLIGVVGSQLANSAIDGLGLKGKGSQAMKDRMANLRYLRKEKKRLNI